MRPDAHAPPIAPARPPPPPHPRHRAPLPRREGVDTCPSQEALYRIFQRLADEGADNNHNAVALRLLVDSSQVGAVLGKRGSIISETRRESGARINIQQRTELPLCAMPSEEVIQVRTVAPY